MNDTVLTAETEESGGPELLTFGCRLNTYESQIMREQAEAAGLSDAVIINTCAVTAEAERQARQAIRKIRRDRPDARIVVTGCAAQVNPNGFARMPEVDQVLGNDVKLKAESWQALANPDNETASVMVNDIMAVKETAGHLISGFDGRTRAFVQVQNGCNHRCTFCIIPFGRGNSRSVPLGEIVTQVRTLVEAGYAEIVLTGVDITSFGIDLPGKPTLGQMIRRLLAQVPALKRLRLSSLDPVEIDDDLWRLIEHEERLLPHLHLSIQAGDDMVLKRMKRRHLRDDAIAVCQKARDLRPDMAFGADIIAGFPTETEEMFINTLKLVEDADLTFLHVFPYSERPDTPAARMPQVEKAVRKERAARLREAGEAAKTRFAERLIGKDISVLVENESSGHSEHFMPVKFDCAQEPGRIVLARVTGTDSDGVIATNSAA